MPRKKCGNPLLDTPKVRLYRRLAYAPDFKAEVQKIQKERTEREKALYAYFGERRPKNLDASTRSLIAKMAAQLKISAFVKDLKPIGRQTRWNKQTAEFLVWKIDEKKLEKPHLSIGRIIRKIQHTLKERLSQYYDNIAQTGGDPEFENTLKTIIKSKPESINTRYYDFISKGRTKKIHESIQKLKSIDEISTLHSEFYPL